MPSTAQSLSALILGVPNPVSMGIARGFMMAGHRLSAIWYPERLRGSADFMQDRELSRRAPGLSLHGLEERARVPVRAVKRLRDWPDATEAAKRLKADVVISLLYPDLITAPLLEAFADRIVNVHPSLLPAYRGPNPIFNMLWDATIEAHGGLTLHLVSPAFDRGNVLARQAVAFPQARNLSLYYMELVKAGSTLLSVHLPRLVANGWRGEPQPDDTPAPQGNRRPQDAVLSGGLTRAHVEWLCATIPQMTPLRIEGLARTIIVRDFVSSAPHRKERPPVIADGLVSFDVIDGHVTVRVTEAGPLQKR